MSTQNNNNIELSFGRTTVIRQNRPVRFRVEMVNGTVIEGVIPANSEFKVTPQEGDIAKFDVSIDEQQNRPHSVG